jgi:hypothetical protein
MAEHFALPIGGYSGQGRKAGALARGAVAYSPPQLDRQRRSMDWGGRTFLRRCARSPVNETKEAIVAVMYAFGRPMTEQELRGVWGKYKRPEILKYHLRTLLEAKVVEIVRGPELQYDLVGRSPCGDRLDF